MLYLSCQRSHRCGGEIFFDSFMNKYAYYKKYVYVTPETIAGYNFE